MSHHCVRLTGNENDSGAYSAFSREPHELRVLVTETGRIWQALGEIHYGPTPGDTITTNNVRAIRPGLGLPPSQLPLILGRRVSKSAPRGTPRTWDLLK